MYTSPHIASSLQLHWFPLRQRVKFKVAPWLVHQVQSGYTLSNLMSVPHYTDCRPRRDRSVSWTRTNFGDRTYCAAGSRCWNLRSYGHRAWFPALRSRSSVSVYRLRNRVRTAVAVAQTKREQKKIELDLIWTDERKRQLAYGNAEHVIFT